MPASRYENNTFQSAAQILRFPKLAGQQIPLIESVFQSAAQILRFPKLDADRQQAPDARVSICRADSSLP